MTGAGVERGVHILLVDDDSASLSVHRAVLEAAGFCVGTASDGPSALRASRARKPHLILLDLMMPGMDGGEVLRRLRKDERTRTVPVVALTGVPEWLQDHRDAAADFDGILLKPVPDDVLIQETWRLIAPVHG
jgi:two-component system, cell cycle response regulator DivK